MQMMRMAKHLSTQWLVIRHVRARASSLMLVIAPRHALCSKTASLLTRHRPSRLAMQSMMDHGLNVIAVQIPRQAIRYTVNAVSQHLARQGHRMSDQ